MSVGSWRERLWWWLPPLVLVLLNLLALGWFQLVYSGDARNVDQLVERRSAELAVLEGVVDRQSEVVLRVRQNSRQVETFYSSRLSTSQERLTAILREVRRLATAAGLEPSSVTYPEDELVEFGLEERGVNFGVEGSYVALRRLINLLELSDSFLTLEEVTLSGSGEATDLRIGLRLSTLFSTRSPDGGSGEEAAP